jgi:hypothetical protein
LFSSESEGICKSSVFSSDIGLYSCGARLSDFQQGQQFPILYLLSCGSGMSSVECAAGFMQRLVRSSKVVPVEDLFSGANFNAEWEALISDHRSQKEQVQSTLHTDGPHPTEESESPSGDESDEDSEVVDLTRKLSTLLLQVEELRMRCQQEGKSRKQADALNRDLTLKISELEEENREIQGIKLIFA